MSAKVLVDSRYEAQDVLENVSAALKEAFAFEQRDLGQAVSAAEIIKVIHQVDGVDAVDLDALYIVTDASAATPTLSSVLQANVARWSGGDVLPAELLLISETGIALEEMTS